MEHHIKSWSESAPRLVAVAAGREAADLVVRDVKFVNVQSREILDWQVAVSEGRIAFTGPDASHCIGDGTRVIDGSGRFRCAYDRRKIRRSGHPTWDDHHVYGPT